MMFLAPQKHDCPAKDLMKVPYNGLVGHVYLYSRSKAGPILPLVEANISFAIN